MATGADLEKTVIERKQRNRPGKKERARKRNRLNLFSSPLGDAKGKDGDVDPPEHKRKATKSPMASTATSSTTSTVTGTIPKTSRKAVTTTAVASTSTATVVTAATATTSTAGMGPKYSGAGGMEPEGGDRVPGKGSRGRPGPYKDQVLGALRLRVLNNT